MKKKHEWYELLGRSGGGSATPLPDWVDEVTGKLLCTQCRQLLHAPPVPDVPIFEMSKQSPFSGLAILGGLGLASHRFLEELGSDLVDQYLYLGRALTKDGKKALEGFSVVAFRHTVYIRGDKTSAYRRCEGCGQHLYSPLGDWHLVAGQEPKVPLAGSQQDTPIVSAEVLSRLSPETRRRMWVTPLPVLDRPLDGREDLEL